MHLSNPLPPDVTEESLLLGSNYHVVLHDTRTNFGPQVCRKYGRFDHTALHSFAANTAVTFLKHLMPASSLMHKAEWSLSALSRYAGASDDLFHAGILPLVVLKWCG
jgi:hypothetical protein